MISDRRRCQGVPAGPVVVVLLAALSGCAIGPRYKAPGAPPVSRYTHRPGPTTLTGTHGPAGVSQHFHYGVSPRVRWWRAFRSRPLDTLIAAALKNNRTLAADRARLMEARAVVAADAGIFYPQINANLGALREKAPSSGSTGGHFPGVYSLYTGGLSVSYYPDVFGANRLVYNSAHAQALFARDQLLAAQLSLIGNVATTAVQAASYRAQIRATRRIIARETELLSLTQLQYRTGAVSYLSVVNQESQLATNKAALPALLQKLALARYELATLIGRFPAQWRPIHLRLSSLHLPRNLPVSLPSVLARERPDIRAATEQMRYANAEVGIADAQFYPIVQITGSIGQESLTVGHFFNAASTVWGLGANLLAPLFHGGTLRAQRREALELYAGARATYEQTVLGAFQQVAGSLRALEHDAEALRAEGDAYAASREALRLAKNSYRAGAIDSLSLLTTEALYSQARIAYVRAEAQRYLDTVALYTALGGSPLAPRPNKATPGHPATSVTTATPQRNAP
ncbi:MAG: efflux transporter outer membrane subunit [Acidiferrobacter thiooxydans]